ncbi:hypothetical protein [Thiomicrorhabdus sediminis]|uniref:Uncharacterized protein n=1 Tax=Thiomicrorhabdus sediminis TaxID=2580412 RepID=A0A4V1HHS7_9GAMM|nr:hypothetical protein [Thiomicrorhabdus sediminis]QCU90063.1 hypothetical protein FE785_05150 [Thiomicrorhabdus sediminis]
MTKRLYAINLKPENNADVVLFQTAKHKDLLKIADIKIFTLLFPQGLIRFNKGDNFLAAKMASGICQKPKRPVKQALEIDSNKKWV